MSKDKLRPIEKLKRVVEKLQKDGLKVVFAYGAFDLLHPGHVYFLQNAKAAGDVLVVGLRSDEAVSRGKGQAWPLVPQDDRAYMLSALECVDFVTLYDDENPVETISCLSPDILVQGSDYADASIMGEGLVKQKGGKAVNIPMLEGHSSVSLIDEIVKRFKDRQ